MVADASATNARWEAVTQMTVFMFWQFAAIGLACVVGVLLVDRQTWKALHARATTIEATPWYKACSTAGQEIVCVVSIDYRALRDKILHDTHADRDTTTPIILSWLDPELDTDTRYVIRRLVWPDTFVEPDAPTHYEHALRTIANYMIATIPATSNDDESRALAISFVEEIIHLRNLAGDALRLSGREP